jgi:biotin carboxyl carrier protein
MATYLCRELTGMTQYSELNVDDTIYETEVPPPRRMATRSVSDPFEVRAFIPGVIAEICSTPGQVVKEQQVLLLLEAMKMFNEVTSPSACQVTEVLVKAGERVEKGQLLVRMKPVVRVEAETLKGLIPRIDSARR